MVMVYYRYPSLKVTDAGDAHQIVNFVLTIPIIVNDVCLPIRWCHLQASAENVRSLIVKYVVNQKYVSYVSKDIT